MPTNAVKRSDQQMHVEKVVKRKYLLLSAMHELRYPRHYAGRGPCKLLNPFYNQDICLNI
jgi:hypothetical protein